MKRTEIVVGRAYAIQRKHWSTGFGSVNDYGIVRGVVQAVPADARKDVVVTATLDTHNQEVHEVPARRVLGLWTEHQRLRKEQKQAKVDAERAQEETMARREAAVPLLPAYAPGVALPWWASTIRDYGDYSGDMDTEDLLAIVRAAYAAGAARGANTSEPQPLPVCTLCGQVVTDPAEECNDAHQPGEGDQEGTWGPHTTQESTA